MSLGRIVSRVLNFAALLAGLLSPDNKNETQEFKNCFYEKNMNFGEIYYLTNNQYPNKYENGSHCRWIFNSTMPIKVNCSIEIPSSNECSEDVFIINDTSVDDENRYCGTGNADLVSQSNVTITLDSSNTSKGGKFACELISNTPSDNKDCKCGLKNPVRIVGGEETAVNEYPMMAGLVEYEKETIFCGATIINEKQVLTAGHCVKYKKKDEIGVVVGEHDMTSVSETDARKFFSVASITVHPNYTDESSDIAIVTVNGTISFNQKVGPVCLPFQHARDNFVDNQVVVLGWGLLEFAGKKSNSLQKTTLSVVNNTKCEEYNERATFEELCTYEAGKDFCQFDSGGPILWNNSKTDNIVLIGVAVSGIGCGGDEPAVSTRVSAFIDWIEENKPSEIQYCKIE